MLFGDYIKQLRESRELTMSEAARRLGITPQKLWDVENNIRYTTKVPRRFLESLAKVYNVPPGVIIDMADLKIMEGLTMSELVAAMLPLARDARKHAALMVNEAREYTPELEQAAVRIYECMNELHSRLENAYKVLYSNTQKRRKS